MLIDEKWKSAKRFGRIYWYWNSRWLNFIIFFIYCLIWFIRVRVHWEYVGLVDSLVSKEDWRYFWGRGLIMLVMQRQDLVIYCWERYISSLQTSEIKIILCDNNRSRKFEAVQWIPSVWYLLKGHFEVYCLFDPLVDTF